MYSDLMINEILVRSNVYCNSRSFLEAQFLNCKQPEHVSINLGTLCCKIILNHFPKWSIFDQNYSEHSLTYSGKHLQAKSCITAEKYEEPTVAFLPIKVLSSKVPGLATSLSRGKNGRRKKARETCNTWHAH